MLLSEDDASIVCHFAPGAVDENLAPSIDQCCYQEEIIHKAQ